MRQVLLHWGDQSIPIQTISCHLKEQTSKHLNIASTVHVVVDVDGLCILLMQIDAKAVLLGMNEDVLELQVSMNNLMSMHVLNTICKLLEDVLCLKLCSTCLQFNQQKMLMHRQKTEQRHEDADCFYHFLEEAWNWIEMTTKSLTDDHSGLPSNLYLPKPTEILAVWVLQKIGVAIAAEFPPCLALFQSAPFAVRKGLQ